MNKGVRKVMGALSLVMVVVLGACGPAAPSGVETATPGVTATAGDMIVLKTTGTIAGVDTELRIDPSGFATLYEKGVQKATLQMTPSALTQTQNLLEDGDFFNLEDRYDKGNVSDARYYALTYARGGQTKTVTAAETGGQGLTPKGVLAVIAKLTQFEWQMTYKREP